MTIKMFQRAKKSYPCGFCGKIIKIGRVYVRLQGVRRGHSHYYDKLHTKCWMLYDMPDLYSDLRPAEVAKLVSSYPLSELEMDLAAEQVSRISIDSLTRHELISVPKGFMLVRRSDDGEHGLYIRKSELDRIVNGKL